MTAGGGTSDGKECPYHLLALSNPLWSQWRSADAEKSGSWLTRYALPYEGFTSAWRTKRRMPLGGPLRPVNISGLNMGHTTISLIVALQTPGRQYHPSYRGAMVHDLTMISSMILGSKFFSRSSTGCMSCGAFSFELPSSSCLGMGETNLEDAPRRPIRPKAPLGDCSTLAAEPRWPWWECFFCWSTMNCSRADLKLVLTPPLPLRPSLAVPARLVMGMSFCCFQFLRL